MRLPESEDLPLQGLQDRVNNPSVVTQLVLLFLGFAGTLVYCLWYGVTAGGRQYAYAVLGAVAVWLLPRVIAVFFRLSLVLLVLAAMIAAFYFFYMNK